MKKKYVLEEIEKAKFFYIDFLIYDNIPLSIKISKKKFKNLVSRFNNNDVIPVDTMITKDYKHLVLFFINRINNLH